MGRIALFVATLVFVAANLTTAYADGGGGGDGAGSLKHKMRLVPYQKLIKAEKYQQAISKLEQALTKSSDDPDLLNLMAYSHRKLNHFEIALDYYQKALQIKPGHRGANEYLGELYLHLGQLEKAEERLAVLDKQCFFGCDEFDDLEKAIDEYRKQNPS